MFHRVIGSASHSKPWCKIRRFIQILWYSTASVSRTVKTATRLPTPDFLILAGVSRSGVPSSRLGKHSFLTRFRIPLWPSFSSHVHAKCNNDNFSLGQEDLSSMPWSRIANGVPFSSPARFYVSMAVKMVLIQFLTRYEFKLADGKIPPSFAWGVARIPHPRMALLVRERPL